MAKVVAFIADINGAGMFQHELRFRPRLKGFECQGDEARDREVSSPGGTDEPLALRTAVVTWIALATLSWALFIIVVATVWRLL